MSETLCHKKHYARTEAHNQSLIPKYLRFLRDGSTDMYQNKFSIKRLQPTTTKKINNNKNNAIVCQRCGKSSKNKVGLAIHQRLNKKCNKPVSDEIIISCNITTRKK